ncbi:M48 family metallopeptidase [Massilia horti]|nr:M48 family metallopeptidase [Massilia horti]
MTSAIYFDGHSARMYQVLLQVVADRVELHGTDLQKTYPRADTRLAEPFAAAPAVLYFNDGGRCEVAGPGREELAAVLGYRKSWVVRWQERWLAALAALVLLVALIVATVFWGVPAAAEKIAAALPASADAALGKSALEGLEAKRILNATRLSDQRVEQVQALMNRIVPAHPRVPVRLLVRASDALGANALALPDGTIVVTDQMILDILDKNDDFDDSGAAALTGVLAHEIGHIERRHAARVLARTSLTAALSATLFGDFSAVAAGVPAVLMNMQYSREMELEADDYALALLRQHAIAPGPLADLLEYLGNMPGVREQRNMPRWLSKSMAYTSSHPSSEERAARLRAGAPISAQPAADPSGSPTAHSSRP